MRSLSIPMSFFWLILLRWSIGICLQSILQFLKCLLLHHLSILKSLDKFKLLHLHLLYGCLVIQSFLFFPLHFLMHLSSGFHFLIKNFFLFLLFSLALLITNEVLYHSGFGYVLIVLMIKQFSLLLFLIFCYINILFYFFSMCSLVQMNFLFLFLFLCFMKQRYLCLFIHFHLLP
jgi:hypothetical protein